MWSESEPVFSNVTLKVFERPARTTPKSMVSGMLNPAMVVSLTTGDCGEVHPAIPIRKTMKIESFIRNYLR